MTIKRVQLGTQSNGAPNVLTFQEFKKVPNKHQLNLFIKQQVINFLQLHNKLDISP